MTHEETLREEAKLFAGHNGDYEMLELSQAILAGAAALALLRKLEWANTYEWTTNDAEMKRCPECDAASDDNHLGDCELARLIGK